jgi:tagaturonate reductase
MRMRCVPLLIHHYEKNDAAPPLFALGFAAYLCFMKAVKQKGKEYYGEADGKEYLIEDPSAEKFYHVWKKNNVEEVVNEVLSDVSIWDNDLSQLNGFPQAVKNNLNSILNNGMKATLGAFHSKKTVA